MGGAQAVPRRADDPGARESAGRQHADRDARDSRRFRSDDGAGIHLVAHDEAWSRRGDHPAEMLGAVGPELADEVVPRHHPLVLAVDG